MSTLDRCDDLAQSIKPKVVLNKLLQQNAFVELADCFRVFANAYDTNSSQIDLAFVSHSRSAVIQIIEKEKLRGQYDLKLSLYKRLAEQRLDLIVNAFVPQMISTQAQLKVSAQTDFLTRANTLLCATASQTFFAIEHCCKIACALGDLDFGRRAATDVVNSHTDVFRTLNALGRRGFVFNFGALAKLYAYAIEARIAADYTDFFHVQYNATGFVFDLMLPATYHVLKSQKDLLFQCAGV
jgi:hypothetical protein